MLDGRCRERLRPSQAESRGSPLYMRRRQALLRLLPLYAPIHAGIAYVQLVIVSTN